MKDIFDGIVNEVVTPLVNTYLPMLLDWILKWTAQAGDAISKAYQWLKGSGHITEFFSGLGAGIRTFIDDFLTLKNAVWGAITGGGLESVNKAIETLKNFWTTISGMKTKLFEGFANAFSGIKEALSGVSGVETSLSFIDALAKAFNYLVELASPFTSALGEITNSFLDWFKALDFSKIGEWLGGIKQFFSDMWSSTAFDGIKGAFSSLKASISSISGSEIASSVLGALGKALSYIVEISRPITTAIGNMARSFVEWFKTLDFSRFSGVFDKLKTVLKDIWEFIKNISAKVLSNVNFGGIFDWISGKVNSLGSLTSISDLFSRFTGTFERFKTLLSSSGKEVGDFTVKTRELGETTKSMLGTHGIFDPILEQLGPIGDKLKKIGEVIYEAFTNLNMENLLGYLKSGATLFALTQFGKFLGSISTSTLLLGKTFISVSGIFDSITNKIGEFGKTIKDGIWTVATGFETLLVSTSKLRDSLRRTNNVKQVFMIALAVAALAGSIWLLATQVPPEKLWQSVGAVAALVVVLAVAVKLLGRGETESSKFDATLLAGAIVGFAAAVLLLIGAMKLLEHVEDFWTAYGKVAAIMALLGIIMAVLIFINKGSKVAGINAAAGMIGILFFAMAVKKLVEALVVLTNEDLDKLQSRMPILIGIIVATVIVAMLAKSVSKFGGSLTLIGIILSIWVFVKALKSLANEDWGLLYATMFKAVVLIGILMAFISFLSLLNNVVPNGSHLEQSRIAGALIGFGVAMVAMAAAMKIVSTINEKDYSRAMGAIFLIGAILIGFTWVARQGSGAHTAQLGVTFVGLSIALLTMVGCVWLLSKIAENSSKMWEGVVAIGVLMLAISIFTYSTKFATSSIGVLVALTVMVTMLSLAIVALAMLPTENAIAAAVGLGFVFVAFGEVLKQLGTLGKEVAKASLVIILIAALVVGIAAILWWMNENIQDPSRLVPIMESIGGVLLAIAGVTWILQYVNMQAAALGAVGMSGVILIIGALGALVAGLQWLCEKYLGFDLLGAVEKGLDLLVIIGGKLGETLAAFTAGATSKGEEVGNNLTKFVEAVTPFVEFLKSDAITPAAMRKLDPIKEFLNTLGELTIDPTLFQTLEGTDTTAVGKSFTELATGFKSYAEVLAGVENWDSVDKASRMIEALSSIAIPGYQPQWNTFLVGAGNFATSLVNMVDILNQAGFTKGDATKMEWFADAVASLATAGESVKGTGTIDWSTFTTGIDSMVHDLKKVAANTAILMSDASRTEAITYLVDVVGDLVELNNAMVPQGGLKTVLWEGERSWKSFTNGLVSFATSLKDFGDEAMLLTDDHKAGIDKAKELTDKLVEMEGTLPTVDGVIKQYFIGAKGTWESFGQGLAAYAYALVAFGEASTGISENQDDADKALALTTKFVNIATNGDLDPSRLYSLGEKIQLFGGQIKSFYDNTKDASSELGGVVQNIVNAFTSDVSALATANMETIGETIALLTTNGINAQSKLFIDSGHGSAGAFFNAMWDDISASKATNAGNMMLNYVRQTFNTFYELFISDGNTAASKFLYGISQKYNDAETSGRVLQTTFRQGINDYDQEFYDSGRQAAQGFVNGLKDEAVNKNAYDAGTALAQNALDGAKDKMKEHSPSKAMFELGSYGAEGFVLGLQDWYSTASFVGSSLSEKALDGLRSTISLMSEAISSDLDTDPVITPILDLSRVSAGAKILNGLVNANPTIGANRFTLNSTPQNEGENASNSGMTFIQNNYSPKALSRTEIYRQTKNQFSAAKGLVDGI